MQLQTNTCDLWLINLKSDVNQSDLRLLSIDELKRLERFKFQKDRNTYAVTRIALRKILAKYTGEEPEEILFSYSEYGKPSLLNSDSGIQFNVSHAYLRSVIGIFQELSIGVDVEHVIYHSDLDTLAQRFFSKPEAAAYLSLQKEQRPEGFFNCWTRKEAFIKAVGQGLSFPLDEFEVSLKPGDTTELRSTFFEKREKMNWTLGSLELEQYKLAWAVRKKDLSCRVIDYEKENHLFF